MNARHLHDAATRAPSRHSPAALLRTMLATPPELLARDEQLRGAATRAGVTLAPLGYAPLFTGQRRYAGEPHAWVICNCADDPLGRHADGLPLPRAVLERLRHLQRGGADFDALYLAHELERGSLATDEALTLAQLEPAPSAQGTSSARRLAVVSRWTWGIALLPGLLASLAAGASLAAFFGTVAAAAPAVAALDPILIGASVPRGRPVVAGELACWHELARWAYDERTV